MKINFILILTTLLAAQLSFSNISTFSHQTYPVSEKLFINLDSNKSTISGEFVFRSAPHAKDHDPELPIAVEVPIWLPLPSERKYELDSLRNLVFNSQEKLTSLLDFKIIINGTHATNFWFNSFHLDGNPVYSRDDILEIVCRVYSNNSIRTNDVCVEVSYNQPLIKSDREVLFFYVPFLNNMKKGHLESHTDDYQITIQCPKDYEIIERSRSEYHRPPTTNEISIIPQHMTPILIELKKANQRFDPIVKTSGNEVEAQGTQGHP